jgi:hypothetical protein
VQSFEWGMLLFEMLLLKCIGLTGATISNTKKHDTQKDTGDAVF